MSTETTEHTHDTEQPVTDEAPAVSPARTTC